ncbi:MAG: MarR family transcriptional regulator [Pseudomonadota bacterium]
MTEQSSADIVFSLFNEIGIINQLSTARFARSLAPDLNPSEFGVLNHFVRLGDGKTPTHLAKAFQMTKPSMTAILSKLEQKGYVAIRASEKDRRRKIVTLTPAGRAARQRGVKSVAPLARTLLQHHDIETLKRLLPQLQTLREFLDAERNAVDGLG